MTKIYGYDNNIYETSIGNIKDMIEPIQNFKFSCTDEEVKKAMKSKSYIEVILEEKDKEIERLNNIINELEKWLETHSIVDFNCSEIIIHEQLALNMAYEYLKELKGEQ